MIEVLCFSVRNNLQFKFSTNAVREEMKSNSEEKEGERTILGSFINAIDFETDKKLSEADIIANTNVIL